MKTKHLLIIFAGAALISLPACATKREAHFRLSPDTPSKGKMARQDYAAYPDIHDTPTCLTYRLVLKAIPYTRYRAFWGNYAGSGCCGGVPRDEMDEIFRRHDIAYAEAKSLRTMQWADEACVEALRKLDTSKMSPEAIAFRDRSASFFSNRALALVGKPLSSYVIVRESKDCPFQCRDDLRELFALERTTAPGSAKPRKPALPVAPEMLASAKPKPQKAIPASRVQNGRRPAFTLRNLLAQELRNSRKPELP